MRLAISMVLSGVVAVVLWVMGYTVFTWQFWAVMVLFCLNGMVAPYQIRW